MTKKRSSPVPRRNPPTNLLYAQSGGVTAVINATAAGVIETARARKDCIGKVIAARNGITGVLAEDLIDVGKEPRANIAALRHTPAGAYGTCRYKLRRFEDDPSEYLRVMEVLKAHDIGFFLYNGGGDSQDTTLKISRVAKRMGYPLACVGIPKTVDNDLAVTDNCPGFGSVAKYVAVSVREAGLDVASMCATSTKVFIMEVMGRHAGWITAAAGLATERDGDAPHILLFPEIPFNRANFLAAVRAHVRRRGYCVVVASEGLRDARGRFLSEAGTRDAFGHAQLGGVAPALAQLVKARLGYKYHWAVSDYLQRAARHLAAGVDVEQAYALGRAAVELALAGRGGVMATVVRKKNKPYRWSIGEVPLARVANKEKKMPRSYITADGFHITPRCRAYLAPLIAGEDWPPFKDGLPQYARLRNAAIPKRLAPWKKPA